MAITVLIADDSPFIIKLLEKVISTDSNLKIIGVAKNGTECITKVITQKPRVVILDIVLPDLSGLNIVNQIMRARPTPVILFSSLTHSTVRQNSLVFDYGMVDFINKPTAELGDPYLNLRKVLIPKIYILSNLKVHKFYNLIKQVNAEFIQSTIDQLKDETTDPKNADITGSSTPIVVHSSFRKLIIIGASTGGPHLLTELIRRIPKNLPPIIIVQHMPEGFIESFATRLDQHANVKVYAAEDGMELKGSMVVVARGGKHLKVISKGGKPAVVFDNSPMVNFVRPSVDVTIKSAVNIYGGRIVTVILTGMGKDGLAGSILVKKQGGKVLALNERDSVIFGMNKAVIEAGVSDGVYSKNEIINEMVKAVQTL